MAGYDDVTKFANTAYNPRLEEIARERERQIADAAARHAARGTVMSGAMVAEAVRIYGESIQKMLHARAEALLEGLDLYEIAVDDAKEAILNELQQMQTHFVVSATSAVGALPYIRELAKGNYIGGELAGFGSRAMGEIRADVERRRLRKKQVAAGQNVNNVYHISGHNVRFNTNSTDNSVNIVTISQQELFTNLRQEITEKIPNGQERSEILQRLDALEQSQGKSFGEKYADFIAIAANHMNIIAPFIPALSELLKKALGS